MALGGGIWLTQNKILPGAYINFVKLNSAGSALGDRGKVAIALPLGTSNAGKVVTITANEFAEIPEEVLGEGVTDNSMKVLGEIFKHANKCYIYNTNGSNAVTVENICLALEPYEFNILAAYTNETEDKTAYITAVKSWRDDAGKKCQLVVYNADNVDHEGVINVVNTVSDEGADAHALVAWVSGAEAGCAVNASCTNKVYDGSYTVSTPHSQKELEQCITGGKLAFHIVYEKVRVLEDINSLVTTSETKGDDFKDNQTIRVCDQIANDIAYLFNTKYLGIIPNDEAGRTSLWADIVKHHRELERIRAIENFDSSRLTVTAGNTKKSIVVTDYVDPINAAGQLYMTVVVQ